MFLLKVSHTCGTMEGVLVLAYYDTSCRLLIVDNEESELRRIL
jgi:hypothetical protein